MGDGVEFDMLELRKFAQDLAVAASADLSGEVRKSMSKGALNIKNQLTQEASGHGTFPHFPRSISYDFLNTRGGVEVEIGPDKARPQGPLANILYFGTSKNGPVLPDPNIALEREVPNQERALREIAEKALGGL